MIKIKMILLFAGIILANPLARAQGTFIGSGVYKRSQDKESTRWTLADWMTQKRSFKAMDQWLALNRTLSSFEFNIEGGRQTYDLEVGGSTTKKEIDHYGASIYWSIFGLEYQFEKSNENYERESAQFNLRILGTSSQTTNITGFYGIRKTSYSNPSNELENQYAGGRINLYFLDFFGVEGQYQKNFRAEDKNNTEYEGERIEYGVFIDLVFVRLYGKAFQDTNHKTDSVGVQTKESREGSEAGIKLYL